MENALEAYGVKNRETIGYCRYCKKETKFVVAQECYCQIDFDGAGYTYSDEYGDCDFCQEKPFCCQNCQGNFAELPEKRGNND